MQCLWQPGASVSTETYLLPPELTLYQVGQAREQLLQAYAGGVRRFDLGHLEAIDSAGAQLLIALLKTAAADGESIEWSQVSATAARTLTTLGLQDLSRADTPLTGAPA